MYCNKREEKIIAMITMRVTEREKEALQKATELNSSKMSTIQAHEEFTKNSKTYTHEEMKEILGL